MLDKLEPLLRQCTNLKGKPSIMRSFTTGHSLLYNASHPDRRTECILVGSYKAFFKTQEGRESKFKVQPHGGKASGSKSSGRAYMKLKPGFVDSSSSSSKEVYLHRLLCYMYHGPPSAQDVEEGRTEAGHRCEHKLCLAGWHLMWMSDGENKERANAKKRRDEVP